MVAFLAFLWVLQALAAISNDAADMELPAKSSAPKSKLTTKGGLDWCSSKYDDYYLTRVYEFCCEMSGAILGIGHHCFAQFDMKSDTDTGTFVVSLGGDSRDAAGVDCYTDSSGITSPDGLCAKPRFLRNNYTALAQTTMSSLKQYTSDYLGKNPSYSWGSQNCQLYSATVVAQFSGLQMWSDIRPYETGCSKCWSCPAPTIYPGSGCPADCGAKCDGQTFGGPCCKNDGSGCPPCTCSSPTVWPFSGCDVQCGAKCGDQCCKVGGVLEHFWNISLVSDINERAQQAIKRANGAVKTIVDSIDVMSKVAEEPKPEVSDANQDQVVV